MTSHHYTHQFNQARFDRHDMAARCAFSGFLTARGYTVRSSGQYDIDFSVTRPDGSQFDFEVEQRTTETWVYDFPFDQIQLPARKLKFAEASPSVVFGICNDDCSRWAVVSGLSVLIAGEIVEKWANGGVREVISVPVRYALQGEFDPF